MPFTKNSDTNRISGAVGCGLAKKKKSNINLLTFFASDWRKQTKQKRNVRKENVGKINKKRENCAKKNLDK